MAEQTSVPKTALGVACGILLVPLLLMAGCVACSVGFATFTAVGAALSGDFPELGTIELRNIEITTGHGRSPVRVRGEIRNDTLRFVRRVSVLVDWLDEDGAVIERSRHEVVKRRLRPGVSKSFEIVSPKNARIRSARCSIDRDHSRSRQERGDRPGR